LCCGGPLRRRQRRRSEPLDLSADSGGFLAGADFTDSGTDFTEGGRDVRTIRHCGRNRIGTGLTLLALTACGCGGQSAPPAAAIDAAPTAAAADQRSGGAAATSDHAVSSSAASQAPAAVGAKGLNAGIAESNPSTRSSGTASSSNASLESPRADSGDDSAAAEIPFASEGTPEWRVYEITRLLAPVATEKDVVSADGRTERVPLTPAEIAVERQARLRQIVAHAGQVIAATHSDHGRESLFTNAVHYLGQAHVELALSGEAESARQLGEVVEAICAAKPESVAAVSCSGQLVELARQMSLRHGRQDPAWARAHATQARLFAERFPRETARAALALLEAGRSCEAAGLTQEARDCYLLLTGRYADTPHADAVAAVLRRMNLPGQTLNAADLGGPTIDGGFLNIEQLRGRQVLVVFWMSDSPTFETDFPRLQALQREQGDALTIVGVNLDADEAAVDDFIEAHPLAWRQIFDPDPLRRGPRNPVARHYGVSSVPAYWLIGPDGRVLAAPADLSSLPIAPAAPSS